MGKLQLVAKILAGCILGMLAWILVLKLTGCASTVNPWVKTEEDLRRLQGIALRAYETTSDPFVQSKYRICAMSSLAALHKADALIREEAAFKKAKREGLPLGDMEENVLLARKKATLARDAALDHCEAAGVKLPISSATLSDGGAGPDSGLSTGADSGSSATPHDAGHGG